MNSGSVSDSEVTPLPRRERDRRQRRADILRAAEGVFADKGYHEASIEEIARAAEYGTGTVYLYFKDKETLYLELVEAKIRDLFNHVAQSVADEKDALTALRKLIQARMEYFDQNRVFFRIYMNARTEIRRPKGSKWDNVVQLREAYTELITRLMKAGQRRGVIRKGDPRQLAVSLSGMMMQLSRDWLLHGDERPLTDSVGFVADLFLHGAKSKA